MSKKIRKSIQAVTAEIEAKHPIIPEPKIITRTVLSQNSTEAKMILAKAEKPLAGPKKLAAAIKNNAPKSIPTTHTEMIEKVIGATKKIPMAKEIDPVILKTGPWEEILPKILEITSARKSKMIYTKGTVKTHIKYRQNQNDIRFNNYDTDKNGVFVNQQK